ncbi:MAG: 5-bromo-4-chloroindolyl phosphate hydrolysis family protein, partial [Oscillospiraceae bacterium]
TPRGRHPYDVRQEQSGYWQQQKQQTGQTQQANRQTQQQTGQTQQQARKNDQKPPKSQKAKVSDPVAKADRSWMTILGTCLAAVGGMGILSTMGEMLSAGTGILPYVADVFPQLGFLGVGTVLIYAGIMNARKVKRFRKYLALIGKRDSIAVETLAQAMSVSVKTAVNDLQDMLDGGILPMGYVDIQRSRLVLTAEGMADAPEPEKPKAEPVKDENDYLVEIKTVNDAIADESMSRKIDHIGEITGKILDYQRKNPNRQGELRSFLNYYLPTTLKILRAYAQLEAQGIEGDNITAAKDRIEGMMDRVVEGFEKQLDKLFQNAALDITSDVEVLEKMLNNDGLSGGGTTLSL